MEALLEFRQLAIEEKRWLDERHQWLCEVIMSPVFKTIEADEQDRLRRGAACMSDLSLIYGERIAACGDLSRALDSGLATATVGDLGHE